MHIVSLVLAPCPVAFRAININDVPNIMIYFRTAQKNPVTEYMYFLQKV
jgi:hypothetical protein